MGKSQQKRDPSQNTNFASGQNRRRRLFGATPVYHEVRWVFTADQSRAFESFFENDLEGGSRKFLMQIDSVNGKDYQLFQFEEMYTGPDKIAGDAYVVSAKLIQFTFDKEYIEVRLPFTEVRSTDHTVSVVRSIGPDGAPDFDLSIGESGKELIADYGITTFSEIDNALNDGKVVLLRIHPLPSTRQYALISSALGGQAFTFSRVTAEKLYTYTCTGLGWSQSSSDLGEKEVFFCRYNNTSYNDIRDAYSAKKLIVMYKSQYNLYEYFLLDARDSHTFQFKKVEKNRITFFTIDDENGWLESSQKYEVDAQIPIASASELGGIKVGQNLTIEPDGTLNAQAGGSGSDNDKVAVDSNAQAGYLENVLDSSSDVISLAKSGNKLYLEFNGEITSDPKISTLGESMINADSAVYGGYNENNFEWGVGAHQCELYLHKRVADAQGLVNRVRFAITALGSGGQNTQGFRFLLMKKDLTVLGASDYFVMGENNTYIGQIHNESLSVPEVGMYEVKMFEESEGSLVINRNTEYYIQIMIAGVSMACYNKDQMTNYTYDFTMKNNLNVQSQVPRTITSSDLASMHQATKTIYCYMGATPVL